MPSFGKNRQWTAVLYNENMRPDWQDQIENLVQLPFAIAFHDKGLAAGRWRSSKGSYAYILGLACTYYV